MSATRPPGGRFQFGQFELDLDNQELRRAGVPCRLQPQPFKVLTLLVSRAGQVVTREELRRELWDDETFVDFEQGLNYCIRQIRAVVGDGAQTPRYVETLPRRGYRFIAPVDGPTAMTLSDAEPKPAPATPPRRRGWLALAVAGLLSALIVATIYVVKVRSWSHRNFARGTIVLADFANTTGDPVFDDTLKQALAIQLEQSPFLSILSDDRVAQTVKMMNRKGERLTLELTREVCLRSNSTAMLAGSIASVGSHYLVVVRAINCQNGDTVARSEAEAANRDRVLTALEKAGNQLRRKLGESVASLNRYNTPLREATTSSLEALKAYSQGAPSDQPESLPYLQRAVRLDPNFAVAYASMGTRYVNFNQLTLANESFKKAYELRERVSERERFYIEASYYTIVTGQLEQANQTYQQWIQEYPKEDGAYVNLGFNYTTMGYYEKAVEVTRESLRLGPDFSIGVGNLVGDYLALGRLDEAKSVADQALARGLDSVDLRLLRYYAAFLQNDTATMQVQVAWAMGKAGVEDWLLSAESDTAAYYGRLSQAHDLSQRAMESAKRNGGDETAAGWKANEALRRAEFGDTGGARRAAEEALILAAGPGIRLLAALAFARSGYTGRARQLADAMDHEFPVNTMIQAYWLPTIRASLELDRGNSTRALELLQATAPYELAQTYQFNFGTMYPTYIKGLAHLKAQTPGAMAAFEKILDHRSIVVNFPLASLAHLQLARAQAMAGDKAASRVA